MVGALAGKRVLIVEDEYFIAADIKRTLKQEGAAVVGPAGNLEAGLALVEEEIDAAVLDVNLEDVFSFPIAERLRGRSVPYLFLTGYDIWSLPVEHRETARLAKPFPSSSVVTMIRALVANGPEAA